MKIHYSLHKIFDQENLPFSASEYSTFKFGDDKVSERFGRDLAQGFIKEHLPFEDESKQIVVVSSPYSYIPTATFAMKNYFVFTINDWLAQHNLPVVQETKIHRTITYKEDYGELSASERMTLIGNDVFHIDKSFLEDKIILFLDDIKITGSHERMITKMIDTYGLKNDVCFLYFAELSNPNIHPRIENALNYKDVSSIFDLERIIKGDRFMINTRIVKYILNADAKEFSLFIHEYDIEFISLLYHSAIGNSYHTIEAYQANIKLLKTLINAHKDLRISLV